jgi:hypothetical protein
MAHGHGHWGLGPGFEPSTHDELFFQILQHTSKMLRRIGFSLNTSIRRPGKLKRLTMSMRCYVTGDGGR